MTDAALAAVRELRAKIDAGCTRFLSFVAGTAVTVLLAVAVFIDANGRMAEWVNWNKETTDKAELGVQTMVGALGSIPAQTAAILPDIARMEREDRE